MHLAPAYRADDGNNARVLIGSLLFHLSDYEDDDGDDEQDGGDDDDDDDDDGQDEQDEQGKMMMIIMIAMVVVISLSRARAFPGGRPPGLTQGRGAKKPWGVVDSDHPPLKLTSRAEPPPQKFPTPLTERSMGEQRSGRPPEGGRSTVRGCIVPTVYIPLPS